MYKNKWIVDSGQLVEFSLSDNFDPDSTDKVWVRKLTIGDRERITEYSAKFEAELMSGNRAERRRRQGGQGQSGVVQGQKFTANIKGVQVFTLSMAIADWTLADAESGDKIPINVEVLSQLDPAFADWLEDRVHELNPT